MLGLGFLGECASHVSVYQLSFLWNWKGEKERSILLYFGSKALERAFESRESISRLIYPI